MVGIHLAYPGGQRLATGMLVCGDLVMTALHTFVRKRRNGSCEHVDPELPEDWTIRVAFVPLAEQLGRERRAVQWRDAEILWPVEPASWFACDLAVLKLKGPPFDVTSLAVAVTDEDELALAVRFNGFPLARPDDGPQADEDDARADHAGASVAENMPRPVDPGLHFLTELAPFSGELKLHDKARNRRILDVAEGGDAPPGISGSVVLHQVRPHPPVIVGVVSAAVSPSYVELMENLGRDCRSVTVALLHAALKQNKDLADLLRARGIGTAAAPEPSALPTLGDHVALLDRTQTCEGIAASLIQRIAPAATAPRAILTLGYMGEDDPYRAIRTITGKLPGALRDCAARGAPPPAVEIAQNPLLLRLPSGRLPRSDVNALLSHLEGGAGAGPGAVILPVIVSGTADGPGMTALAREAEALLRELAGFPAPLALLLFLDRGPAATAGAALHDRLATSADAEAPALPSLDFMGDLEWIDEHAIAQWGDVLLRMPGMVRWTHLVSPRIDALRDRVYRLYDACPQEAKAYPRLRRVVDLITEIQTPTRGTTP